LPGFRPTPIGGFLHLSEHAQHRLRAIVQGPAYGTAYNRLQRVLAKEGRLGTTGCPEEAF
jgi:hypothetical protein